MDLREIVEDDWVWVLKAMEEWEPTQRWSLGGFTPTPARVSRLLVDGVVFQAAIWTSDGPSGIAQVVSVNEANGYGQLEVLVDTTRGVALESAVARFVELAFHRLRLRKLCVSACRDELDVPRHLDGLVEQVGRLGQHSRRSQGTYADVLVFEIWNNGRAPE